jgi:hypothetical protein
MARGKRRRKAAAYALCEGVPRSSGWHGIGVVIRDTRHHRLGALADQVRGLPPDRARFAAIAAALRASRRLGIDRLIVYCHDPSVVNQINRREPTPPERLAGCLEVRALLNMFRYAEVATLPWPKNLEAIGLARQAAAQPPPGIADRAQPALPLTG